MQLPGTPGVAGEGDLDLGASLPTDPALACLHIYVQILGIDSAAPKGISMSNGLDMFIGE